MSDKVLDSTQVISGIAILLSFFVGYKYGLRTTNGKLNDKDQEKAGGSSDSQRIRVRLIFAVPLNYRILFEIYTRL